GYHITVDGNSTIAIWNDITNAGEFSVAEGSNLTLDFANGVGNTYKFAQMNSQNSTKYYLDVDFKTKNFDQFIVQNGSGTIYIAGLNLLNDLPNMSVTLQILQAGAAAASNGMRIDIDPNILKQYSTSGSNQTRTEYTTAIGDTIYWSQALGTRVVTYNYSSSLALSKTGSTYDSLTYTYNENILSEKTTLVDALRLYAKYNDDLPVKHFISTGSDSVYNVTEDFIDNGVAEIVKGVLYVTGELSGANEITSTINANSHKMFTLDAASRLNIENVRITGIKNEDGAFITNNGGGVTLINTTVGDKQSAAGAKAAIINNSDNFTIGVNSNSAVNTVTLNQSLIGTGKVTVEKGALLSLRPYTTFKQSLLDIYGDMNTSNNTVTIDSPVYIHSGAGVSAETNTFKQAITNDGSLTLWNNALSAPISGSGNLTVYGDVTFNNTVAQNQIRLYVDSTNGIYSKLHTKQEYLKDPVTKTATRVIVTNGSDLYLSSDSTSYTANVYLENLDSDLYIVGSTLKTIDADISGTGYFCLENTPNINLTNNAIIAGRLWIRDTSATFTTDPNKITFANNSYYHSNWGTINLKGGTSSNPSILNLPIRQTGTTNILSGSYITFADFVNQFENTLNIQQNATLTSSANNFKSAITNQGTLNLTTGTMNGSVSGSGKTNISGTVYLNAIVSNIINVNANSILNTNFNNIKNTITNNGTVLTLGGTLNYDIKGNGIFDARQCVSDVYIAKGVVIEGSIYTTTDDSQKGYLHVVDSSSIKSQVNGVLYTQGGYLDQNVTGYLNANSLVRSLVLDPKIQLYNRWNTDTTRVSSFGNASQVASMPWFHGLIYLTGGTVRSSIGGSGSWSSDSALVGMIGDVVQTNNQTNYVPVTIYNKDMEINFVGWDYVPDSLADYIYKGSDGKYYTKKVGSYTVNISTLMRKIVNEGKLYASGTLKAELYRDAVIKGKGTTYINKTLTFDNNSTIEGTLNLNNGTIPHADLLLTNFNVGKITGTGNFTIDLDGSAGLSDTITISDKTSDARITISDLNLKLTNTSDLLSGIVFQILKGGSNAQLILPQSVIDKAKTALPIAIRTEDTITKAYKDDGSTFSLLDSNGNVNVNFNNAARYGIRVKNGTGNATLSLASTQSTNDSLKLSITGTKWTTDVFTRQDVLGDMLAYDTTKTKTFTFNSADDVYTMLDDYASSVKYDYQKGNIVIKGVYDATTNKYSTINGYKIFNISIQKGSDLKVSNVKFDYVNGNGYTSNTHPFNIHGGTATFENIFVNRVQHFLWLTNGAVVDKISAIVEREPGGDGFLYMTGGSIVKDLMLTANGVNNTGYKHYTIQNYATIGYQDTTKSAGDENRYLGGIHDTILNRIQYCYGFGGIFNGSQLYNISDTKFTFNRKNPTVAAQASNFRNSSAAYNVKNLLFYSNYADSTEHIFGISIYNDGTFYLGIRNVDFINTYALNNLGPYGLAIYNSRNIGYAGYNNLSIDKNTFAGNYSTYSPRPDYFARGMAIYNTGTITYGITNSNFIGNYIQSLKTTYENSNLNIEGGAIYNIGTLPTISNTHFYNNYLNSIEGSAFGGAIWTNKALATSGTSTPKITDTITISGKHDGITSDTNKYTTFINNYTMASSGQSYGGAIYTENVLNIANTFFLGNYVSRNTTLVDKTAPIGGAIFLAGNVTSSINNSLFVGNYIFAGNGGSSRGGAIYKNTGTLNISNTSFVGNYGASSATDISSVYGVSKTVTSSTKSETVLGNTITYTTYQISNIAVKNILKSGKIADINTAIPVLVKIADTGDWTEGGAIANMGGTLNLDNVTFDSNAVYGRYNGSWSGAIRNSATMTAKNSVFTGNLVASMGSSSYGGAMYSSGSGLTITGDNSGSAKSRFDSNIGISQNIAAGGAIYSDTQNASLKIINTDFTNNYVVGSATTKAT
ncbi:TPA: hypothetical protein CPT80_02125, partial [Candidatus Gastranaerophilales bacterium HUM_9]